MKNETQQKLELFAKHNNWQIPHPLDMERFYKFVIEAFENGDTEITDDEFSEIFKHYYKLSEEDLNEWIIKYENGIELLRVYNK